MRSKSSDSSEIISPCLNNLLPDHIYTLIFSVQEKGFILTKLDNILGHLEKYKLQTILIRCKSCELTKEKYHERNSYAELVQRIPISSEQKIKEIKTLRTMHKENKLEESKVEVTRMAIGCSLYYNYT